MMVLLHLGFLVCVSDPFVAEDSHLDESKSVLNLPGTLAMELVIFPGRTSITGHNEDLL